MSVSACVIAILAAKLDPFRRVPLVLIYSEWHYSAFMHSKRGTRLLDLSYSPPKLVTESSDFNLLRDEHRPFFFTFFRSTRRSIQFAAVRSSLPTTLPICGSQCSVGRFRVKGPHFLGAIVLRRVAVAELHTAP